MVAIEAMNSRSLDRLCAVVGLGGGDGDEDE